MSWSWSGENGLRACLGSPSGCHAQSDRWIAIGQLLSLSPAQKRAQAAQVGIGGRGVHRRDAAIASVLDDLPERQPGPPLHGMGREVRHQLSDLPAVLSGDVPDRQPPQLPQHPIEGFVLSRLAG